MSLSPEARRKQQQLDFLARLRRAVEASGLSQKELALRLGVAESSVTGWLKKGALPGADVLFDLPYVIGVSADWLLAGRGTKQPPTRGPKPEAEYMEGGLTILGEVEIAIRTVRDRWVAKAANQSGEETFSRVGELSTRAHQDADARRRVLRHK